MFAHTLYVLFVQENVGTLYSNILSKKASSLSFCVRVHAYVHAGMCVTVRMGVVCVFPVCR